MKSTSQSLRSWLLALSAGTMLSSSLTVMAVEYTWDSDAAAGIQTGDGSWATFPAASNWTLDAGVTRVVWPNTGTDSAVVTGACTLSVNNLDIKVDDFRTTTGVASLNQTSSTTVVRALTLTGGTYDGTGTTGSRFTVNGTSLAIGGVVGTTQFNLAGNSDLVKLGSGSLFLASSNNTFTGRIFLLGGFTFITSGSDSSLGNAGNLVEVNSGALSAQTSPITIGSGHTIRLVGGNARIGGNAVAMTLQGPLIGGGSLNKISTGDLNLEGAASYGGTTTISEGILRLQSTGTIPGSSNLTINGGGNFNIRNTIGWIYNGTITGDNTGSINLNTGTDATLAGPISGVADILVNNLGTDTTISGNISGSTNVTVQTNGGPILRLSGSNSYTGGTTILDTGILILESATALSDVSDLSIGNGTLNATAVGTDSTKTLDVTSTATINLAAGAKLAFADSSAVDWTGGTLNITGAFESGSSLNFGVGGLSGTQLGLITAAGFVPGSFALDPSGFLTATSANAYTTWTNSFPSLSNTAFDFDFDNDGIATGLEWVLGGNPTVNDSAAIMPASAGSATSGITLTFHREEDTIGVVTLAVEYGTTLASFPDSVVVGATSSAPDGNGVEVTVNDVPVPDSVTVNIPASNESGGKLFARLKATMP